MYVFNIKGESFVPFRKFVSVYTRPNASYDCFITWNCVRIAFSDKFNLDDS